MRIFNQILWSIMCSFRTGSRNRETIICFRISTILLSSRRSENKFKIEGCPKNIGLIYQATSSITRLSYMTSSYKKSFVLASMLWNRCVHANIRVAHQGKIVYTVNIIVISPYYNILYIKYSSPYFSTCQIIWFY